MSAAQVIASNTSTPDQKAQAYSMMFTVLSNDATVGALAVYNAIMDYQRMVCIYLVTLSLPRLSFSCGSISHAVCTPSWCVLCA